MQVFPAPAIVVLAATVLAAGRAFAWAPDAHVETTLAQGKAWADVLPSADGAGLIHAAIDIPAPPRVVWSVMTDCRLAARLVISVTSCKVLEADQNGAWDVREQVTRGGMFFPSIRNVFRSDYQPFSLIRFHRLSGDLRIEEGEWRLEPRAGGRETRVIYVNRVAVNLFAPAFLVRAGIRHDTPNVLLNLRRESVAAARQSGAPSGPIADAQNPVQGSPDRPR